MSNVVPTIEELRRLPDGLDAGESTVLDILTRLGREWTIYVRPIVGWHRPDFIAAHPRYGICVIEVEDWTVGSIRQSFDGTLEVFEDGEWNVASCAPSHQAALARLAVMSSFFGDGDPCDPAVVRGVVILPRYSTVQACALFRRANIGDRGHFTKVWGGQAFIDDPLCVVTGHPRRREHDVSPVALVRLEQHCIAAGAGLSLRSA